MDSRLATVVVVGLVLFSGCNLFADGAGSTTPTAGEGPGATTVPTGSATPTGGTPATATPTPTGSESPTPSPDPPTPTPSERPGDLDPVSTLPQLPDGVTADGVRNVTALYRGHVDLLAAGGYEYAITETTDAGGSGSATERYALANDTVATLTRLTAGGDVVGADAELSVYRGPEVAGIFNRTADAVRYGYGPTNVRLVAELLTAAVSQRPAGYVTAPDWRVAGANTSVPGERRVVLVADSLRGTLPDQRADDAVRSLDARMALTPAGLVRSLDLSVTFERPGAGTVERNVTLSVDGLASGALSDPDWLATAPRLEASLADGDRLLAVEHAGGADVAAETSLSVGGRLAELGNVTVDRRLSEGDVLYVYATAEDGESSLEHAVNRRPTLPENATSFGGRVVVSGSQGRHEFGAAADPSGE